MLLIQKKIIVLTFTLICSISFSQEAFFTLTGEIINSSEQVYAEIMFTPTGNSEDLEIDTQQLDSIFNFKFHIGNQYVVNFIDVGHKASITLAIDASRNGQKHIKVFLRDEGNYNYVCVWDEKLNQYFAKKVK